MKQLTISLLGTLHVAVDGVGVTGFRSSKALALLAYLAVESSRAHSRATLASLFWSNQTDKAAYRNLRLTLHRLRQALGESGAESRLFRITRETIQFFPQGQATIDVVRFEELANGCAEHAYTEDRACLACAACLHEAITLYQGDLLTGFVLEEAEPFMEWLQRRCEPLHQQALGTLDRLIAHHRRRSEWEDVCRYARRQIELEPWLERAHRSLIDGLARSGKRSAALAQYKQCRRILEQHLGVSPDQETSVLYERVQATRDMRRSSLPPQTTPFIGRAYELAEIGALLDNPDCRLLTLVGPGGIGKTRLALRVAEHRHEAGRYLHGVYFVSLSDVDGPEFLAPAIAQALSIRLHGNSDPQTELEGFVRDKELLLVLDNFEHILDATSSVRALLRAAPALQILVTSREVLNTSEEWLYSVHGLTVPPTDAAEDIACYSAVQLFINCARRVNRHFHWEREQSSIIRVCRLVEGIPLAIELGAAWTRLLTCAEIADQIERRLEFLSTNLHDVPERHRSMRAAFDQSWHRLTKKEQATLCRLAVFHGNFQHAAAAEVAGASLHMLRTLLDKSLLRRAAGGRYHLHQLLRQYAHERLAGSPDDTVQTYAAHARYYMDFLAQRRSELYGGRQRLAAELIAAELDNIRSAWTWVLDHAELEMIAAGVQALSLFYQFQSRYAEGKVVLEQTVCCLDRQSSRRELSQLLALTLSYLGGMYYRLGEPTQAGVVLRRSRELYDALGEAPAPGQGTDPRLSLAALAFARGDYSGAATLLDEALAVNERIDHQLNLQMSYCGLAKVALGLGQYEEARSYASRSYTLARQTQDDWFMAYCLVALGNVEELLGQYAQAKQRYWQSYAIREAFQDTEGMALVLSHLGKVALLEKCYQEATRFYGESVALYRQINDRGGLATALNGLGAAALAESKLSEARHYLLQALQVALEIEFISLVLAIFTNIAELLFELERSDLSPVLLAHAINHPASDRETRSRASYLQVHYGATPLPDSLVSIGPVASERLEILAALAVDLEAALGVKLIGSSGSDASTHVGVA